MAVRLNKAIKELNVGLNTVAEFLQKKGMPLEDASPNAKITDEQHQLLMNEFVADKKKKEETDQTNNDRKKQGKEKKANRREQEKAAQTIYRPEGENKQQIKIVGNLKDLNKPAQKPVGETKPAAEVKPSVEAKSASKPVAESPKKEPETKPVEQSKPEAAVVKQPEVEAEQKPTTTTNVKESDSGVFKVKTPESPLNFRVVGKIDLEAINDKTRPQKKSKEEKKKEREEKELLRKGGKNNNANNGGQKPNGGNGDGQKRRRQRINGKEKVDVNDVVNQQQQQKKNGKGGANKPNPNQHNKPNNQQQGVAGGKKKNKKGQQNNQQKQPEAVGEDYSKQVKENLARLTSKQLKSGAKNRRDKRDRRRQEAEEVETSESKVLKLTEFVTANELATMMNVPVTQVIGTCMSIGMMVSINQRLDAETINIVAEEFGFSTTYVSEDVSNAIEEVADAEEDLESRAPIITVMGHVDHGKTSLLDYIRNTNVIAGEAGGITQHIGAYNVKMKDGRHITFLDTPGHEAFTAMRARGAKVTDIAIIIIAADDDVMPQTKEAISHAVAANVPMVFAINKVDKPGANPDKIKEQLGAMNYLVEEWGGKYQSQDISAKKGIGVDELMEKVLLEAEMLDLKANPNRNATGSIIESTLDKGRGYVATVLVQNGTLKQGDVVLAGTHYGKIKAMFNERGQRIKQALPAEPAVILGLDGAPTAGDTFHVMDSEQEAREVANKRQQLKREQGLRTLKRVDLNEIGRRIALGDFKELNLIVKGDVDGSIEALSDSLIKLSTEKIQVNVIHKAVGQISESDVTLAEASDAIIIGFQVRPSAAARRLADQAGVDIRLYSIIYDTIEEIKDAMEGMLAPVVKEENTATAEVRAVYKITKVGTVAGAFVTDGRVHRSDKIRVIRDGIVVHTGEINALKRFKEDVKEVSRDFECGISIVNYNDLREGDILETYTEVKVKQKL